MKLQIEYIPVNELEEYSNNTRKHDTPDITQIAKSIEKYGFNDPIGIWSDHQVIVEGHGRLAAAKSLGMTEVPCVRLDHLTDEQRREYGIAHNKTAELSEWDFEKLEKELADLDMGDFDFGFEDEETSESAEVVEDDYDEELPAEPKAKLGDIYQLGRHRLLCGDSTDKECIQSLLGNVKPDLLMTDPPYGIEANKMTMGSGKKEFHRGSTDWDASRPNLTLALTVADTACIWGGNYFTDELPPTNDWLCWHKKNDGLSFSEFELA